MKKSFYLVVLLVLLLALGISCDNQNKQNTLVDVILSSNGNEDSSSNSTKSILPFQFDHELVEFPKLKFEYMMVPAESTSLEGLAVVNPTKGPKEVKPEDWAWKEASDDNWLPFSTNDEAIGRASQGLWHFYVRARAKVDGTYVDFYRGHESFYLTTTMNHVYVRLESVASVPLGELVFHITVPESIKDCPIYYEFQDVKNLELPPTRGRISNAILEPYADSMLLATARIKGIKCGAYQLKINFYKNEGSQNVIAGYYAVILIYPEVPSEMYKDGFVTILESK